ncbi:MAG TPA: trypsin-like peptidase domain-containing protein [Candidatus Acidoferrales bacterium]|nr:trypsin-like peptidase domain-containing protein [Candidatus Acidoferrales bacterium]
MNRDSEKIVIVEAEPTGSGSLVSEIGNAGFDVKGVPTLRDALEAIREPGADLVLLDLAASPTPGTLNGPAAIAALRGSGATEHVRLIVLVGPSPEERAAALDLGADDAVSLPWVPAELLARVRTQLRARRADRLLVEKAQIAEEGQKIAHTAFGALAVTEKMAEDATSLDRRLKRGVTGVLAIAVVMAAIYFLFVRKTSKDLQLSSATISRLERSLMHQEDLMAEARKLRETQPAPGAVSPVLEPTPGQKTGPGGSAVAIISEDVQSVCLLHVSVAFRNTQSGRRLRYAGLNQQGEPLQDSDGNPILTLEGNGPELKLDVFGTGFNAARDGRIMTNRHVAEPWWKNEKLGDLTSQGLQAEISSIHAYFPGDSRAFKAEIQGISKDTDLATVHVELGDLKRPILSIDPSQNASQPGEAIVLMGYATGLAAILARTDEDTAQQIVKQNGGEPSRILAELARRNLIRPIITQGHIGDVLPDRIVFDAQTTSGGSGGPLFNQQGKVIGVTFAVLEGFGGSNFGIPIRFSAPLLVGAVSTASN